MPIKPFKLSLYLQKILCLIQDKTELLQFVGWFLCLGITLPLMASIFVVPQVILTLFFVIGIVWLAIIWKTGVVIIESPIDIGMFAIFLAVLVSTHFSIDPSRGIRTIWQWLALILLFYMMLALFRMGASFYALAKALLIVTSIFVFFGYVEFFIWLFNWYTQREWPFTFPSTVLRASGLISNPNPFGGLLSMVFSLAVVVFIEFKNNRSIWWWMWLITTGFMLIITQSRGAWLGLLLALAVYGLGKAWSRSVQGYSPIKVWGYVTFAIVGSIITLLILLFVLRPSTFTTDNSLSIHLGLWQIALDGWQQFPWFGGGPNTYPTIELQATVDSYTPLYHTAHNFYLNTLAEMGLIGIVTILLLIAQILLLLWRQRRQWNKWAFVFFTPLVVTAIHSQFDMVWLRTMVLASIFLAALVASLTPYQRRNEIPSYRFHLSSLWVIIWLFIIVSGIVGSNIVEQYKDGVEKVSDGDWQAASRAFHRGQSFTPYEDSLFLIASGFSDGVLAIEYNCYLSSAIEAQEQLIKLEPGWSAHRANLASLYRQAGRKDEAVATMQQAITLTPDVPSYYLNLGLWYEEDGDFEAAVFSYQELYQLSRTWRDAPFWSMPVAAYAVVNTPYPVEGYEDSTQHTPNILGYDALSDGNIDMALDIFQTMLVQRQTADAYLGLGISYLHLGDVGNATYAFEQANIWSTTDTMVNTISLWQEASSPVSENILSTTVEELQHYYSINGINKFSNYMLVLFEVQPIPHDLLPQLSCFTFPPDVGIHMQLLQKWYVSRDDAINAAYIEQVLLGEGNGLAPCTPLVNMSNEGMR